MVGLYDALIEGSSYIAFLQCLIGNYKRRVMFIKHEFAQTNIELGNQCVSKLKNTERRRQRSLNMRKF